MGASLDPVRPHDPHHPLAIPKPQFGGGEEPIDDHVVAPDTVIDELTVPFRSDHEERRHLALANPARELDEDLPPVIEGAARPPGRAVAGDPVAEVEIVEIDIAPDGKARLCTIVLAPKRDQVVFGVLPGYGGHIGLRRRAQFEVIGAPVGVDDEIGHEIGPGRFHEHMDAAGLSQIFVVNALLTTTVEVSLPM